MREMYPDDSDQRPPNPYEFIVNPQQPKRRGLKVPGVRNPFLAKLLLVVVVVAIVVAIAGVLLSSVFSKQGINAQGLIGVAQSQQELVRVSKQGAANGTQSVTRIFSTNVELSLQTEQLQLLAYLKKQGYKPSTKTLSLKKSSSTDTQLTTAIQSSTFDSIYVQLMQNSLVAYNTELEQASNNATGANEKKIIAGELSAASMLLQQVPTQESLQNGS